MYAGEDEEVHRQQKGDRFERNVTGTNRTYDSGGKELDCAVCEKQSDERKQNTAGVKAPGQQYAGQEDRVIVEVDYRGRE